MGLRASHIGNFDRSLDVFRKESVSDDGDTYNKYGAAIYSGIKAQELSWNTTDKTENMQDTFIRRKAWKIRKHNRVIKPDDKILDTFDNVHYFVTGTHPFKGDRRLLVVEAVYRDNIDDIN